MRAHCILLVLLLTCIVAVPAAAQTPQGTAFTYQGELRQNGNSVTGNTDMVFELYDAPVGGNPVGTPLTFTVGNGNPVAVSNGIFTVALDFGSFDIVPGLFARYLQVTVGSTILTPRTKIENAPFALQSRTAQLAYSLSDHSVGVSQIIADQVQQRVTGICAAGTAIRSVTQDGSVICQSISGGTGTVTSVATDATLTGGPIVSSGTLGIANGGVGLAQINAAQVQTRVTGTCPAGSYMRGINSDGSVQCAAIAKHTIFVPSAGTPQENGAALRAAVTSVNSSTEKWLVKLDAGDYDLGSTALEVGATISIQGSGTEATKIMSSVDSGGSIFPGGITLSGSISELMIESASNTHSVTAICLLDGSKVTRASISSFSEAGTAIGVARIGGLVTATIRDVSISSSTNSGYSRGIDNGVGLGEYTSGFLNIVSSEVVAKAVVTYRSMAIVTTNYENSSCGLTTQANCSDTNIDRSTLTGSYWLWGIQSSTPTPSIKVKNSNLVFDTIPQSNHRVSALCSGVQTLQAPAVVPPVYGFIAGANQGAYCP